MKINVLQIIIWNIMNLARFSLLDINEMPQTAFLLQKALETNEDLIKIDALETYAYLTDTYND